jgi:hypothetical protein
VVSGCALGRWKGQAVRGGGVVNGGVQSFEGVLPRPAFGQVQGEAAGAAGQPGRGR